MTTKAKNGAEAATRTESETIAGFHFIRREAITLDPTQPRKTFDPVKLQELADSIADIGIVQNLVVRFVPQPFTLHEPDLTSDKNWFVLDQAGTLVCRDSEKECRAFIQDEAALLGGDGLKPKYVLVAGERRLRASELAKVDLLPCMVREAMAPKDVVKAQFAENDGREPLSAMDEAESFHDLVYGRKLFTVEELAKELNKSRSHVFGRLKLAVLPHGIKQAVACGKLNAALAELVAKVPGGENQLKAMKEILKGGEVEYLDAGSDSRFQNPMSVRQAKKHLRDKYMLDLDAAPFDVKEKELVAGVGTCHECPKRSGNCTALFPELEKSPNVCTDPACYESKRKAKTAKLLAGAAAKGLSLVPDKSAGKLFQFGNQFDPYHEFSLDVDRKFEKDKGKRTFKQILGKDLPAKSAVVSPSGEVVEFYQKDLIVAALEQKGFKMSTPEEGEDRRGGESAEAEAAREQRKTARESASAPAVRQVLEAVGKWDTGPKGITAFLKGIAVMVYQDSWYALNQFCEKNKIKVLKDEPDVRFIVSKMSLKEIMLFLVEVDLCAKGTQVQWNGDWHEDMLAAAEFTGVSLLTLEEEAVKALNPEKKFEAEIAANDARGMATVTGKPPALPKKTSKKKKGKKK